MIAPLSDTQQRWVEATLASLTTEEKVAQLLIPNLGAYDNLAPVEAFLHERMLGGIFVGGAIRDQHRQEIGRLQARCRIPMVVAADLEAGAGSGGAWRGTVS